MNQVPDRPIDRRVHNYPCECGHCNDDHDADLPTHPCTVLGCECRGFEEARPQDGPEELDLLEDQAVQEVEDATRDPDEAEDLLDARLALYESQEEARAELLDCMGGDD